MREGFWEEADHMCVRSERWGDHHVGREVVMDIYHLLEHRGRLVEDRQ